VPHQLTTSQVVTQQAASSKQQAASSKQQAASSTEYLLQHELQQAATSNPQPATRMILY